MRCSIIPPHILKAIAERGTPEQREAAQRQLVMSERLRFAREVLTLRKIQGLRGLVAPLPGSSPRSVYDLQHGETIPGGELIRKEGGPPTNDVQEREAYDGAGETLALYRDHFHREGIDGNGMAVASYIHYGDRYDNAMWDGQEMCYGDGDGDFFNRFTIAIDIIGHELSHGVCQHTANLDYYGQPGALNESNSDVFGSLVKQRHYRQSAVDADWLIGEGLFTAQVHGRALRSMKAPGTAYDDRVIGMDPQPDNMGDYVKTREDNGGVHINSGIPNKAFYHMAVNLGGDAWQRAGLIWFTALTTKWTTHTTFQQAADTLALVAREQFDDAARKAVIDAWGEVGIRVTGEPAPAPAPTPGCPPIFQLLGLDGWLRGLIRDAVARELRGRGRTSA